VQEVYLESLKAIGIDLREHDIKFEEDNWEWPVGGAWGVGWQVMLDGLEITQFTYFQQCGGMDLDPISGEITYGLERIAAFLQDVNSLYDVVWAVDGPAGASTGAAATCGPPAMVGMRSAASPGGSRCATATPAPIVNTFSRASVATAMVRVRCTNIPFAGSECAQQLRAISPVVDGPAVRPRRCDRRQWSKSVTNVWSEHGR